jgi:hypothetical protein
MKCISNLTTTRALMFGGILCLLSSCVSACFNLQAAALALVSGVILLFAAGVSAD